MNKHYNLVWYATQVSFNRYADTHSLKGWTITQVIPAAANTFYVIWEKICPDPDICTCVLEGRKEWPVPATDTPGPTDQESSP